MDDYRCLFVEVEPWEKERIREMFKECGEPITSEQVLAETEVDDRAGIVVISPFIHSRIDQGILDLFPGLKLIATRSTGLDHIDLDACAARGVLVSNVPVYGANTVAEHTFGLILSLTRRVHKAYEQTTRGRFSIERLRGIDLRDRTIGVVGTGAIGTHVIRIALGFQMNVLAYDVKPVGHMADALGFEYVDLDELLRRSDIVTLHAPLNDKTRHLIDEAAVSKMKPGVILINTARGGLVDTQALVAGLRSERLGGAGLDVLEDEEAVMEESEMLSRRYDAERLQTLVENHVLLRMDNVIITPHIGFNSEEALDKILDTTADNVSSFLAGNPQNIVGSGSF
jgi:D-lactate dehydrogenase